MLVGERVFGQSPFGEDSFGKYTWCLKEAQKLGENTKICISCSWSSATNNLVVWKAAILLAVKKNFFKVVKIKYCFFCPVMLLQIRIKTYYIAMLFLFTACFSLLYLQ